MRKSVNNTKSILNLRSIIINENFVNHKLKKKLNMVKNFKLKKITIIQNRKKDSKHHYFNII